MKSIVLTLVLLAVATTAFGQNAHADFTCAGKTKYCKHMGSCAEACYYFLQCGEKRLDRDKDNIPCENVCRSPCKGQVKKRR